MPATLALHTTTSGLGGAATGVAVSGTAMNNVFDNVSPAEAVAGMTDYRAIDIKNTGDAAATVAKFYTDETTSTDTVLQAAIEATPANAIGSTKSIASETTAPTGLSAFAAVSSGSPLSLPDIPAGSYCRVWLKRIVTAEAVNASSDSVNLSVEYA